MTAVFNEVALPLIDGLKQLIRHSITSARILLVGDTLLGNQLVQRVLRGVGFSDIHSVCGSSAIEQIGVLKPNLVLVEAELIEVDRIELCRTLCTNPQFINLPVIVQTDVRDRSDGLALFAMRVSDIISKPINPNELITRVVNHLERAELMRELRLYHDRTWQELDSARRMQLELLPVPPIQHGMVEDYGVRVATFYQPSSEIGGDIWGVLPVNATSFGIFLADFAGHGVTAALNTFRLHTLILELKSLHADPCALLAKLNDALAAILPRGQFATFFYAVFDLAMGRLKFASAGAPAPILKPENGLPALLLDSSGLPLGVVCGTIYELHEHSFGAGSKILLFSDGLSEFPDLRGNRIGEEALRDAIDRSEPNLAPDQLVHLVRAAAGIEDECQLPDDTMIICVDRQFSIVPTDNLFADGYFEPSVRGGKESLL